MHAFNTKESVALFPSIHQERVTLFRFGHTMIPPGIYRRDRQCDFKKARNGGPATRLCSVWWDAQVSHVSSAVQINGVEGCESLKLRNP